MTEFQNCLRFSLDECVNFRNGQEVAEICSVKLNPNVTCHEFDQYVILRGTLDLSGEYCPCTTNPVTSDFYAERNCATVSPCNEDGICAFRYSFPVDVTIPAERVRTLDEIHVSVSSLDCDVQEDGCLRVCAEVCVDGVYEREFLEQTLTRSSADQNAFGQEETREGYTYQPVNPQEQVRGSYTNHVEAPQHNAPNAYSNQAEVPQHEASGGYTNQPNVPQQDVRGANASQTGAFQQENHQTQAQFNHQQAYSASFTQAGVEPTTNQFNAFRETKASAEEQTHHRAAFNHDTWGQTDQAQQTVYQGFNNHAQFEPVQLENEVEYYQNAPVNPTDVNPFFQQEEQLFNHPNHEVNASNRDFQQAPSWYQTPSPVQEPSWQQNPSQVSPGYAGFANQQRPELHQTQEQANWNAFTSSLPEQFEAEQNAYDFEDDVVFFEPAPEIYSLEQEENEVPTPQNRPLGYQFVQETDHEITFAQKDYDKVIFPFANEAKEEIVTPFVQKQVERQPESKFVHQEETEKPSQTQPQKVASSPISNIFAARAEQNSCLKIYIVQRGDSLENLSQRYGINAARIARHNQLQPNAAIEEGKILYIPE